MKKCQLQQTILGIDCPLTTHLKNMSINVRNTKKSVYVSVFFPETATMYDAFRHALAGS